MFVSDLQILRRQVRRSKKAAFAPGTWKNFRTQWYSFVAFTTFFDLDQFPSDPEVFCLYAQLLSRSFKSNLSVKNYISGVKIFYSLLGLDCSVFDAMELKLTLRGISRIKQHSPRHATPINPDILLQIYEHLDMADAIQVAFWALFVVAFFSMARKSNLVVTEGKSVQNHTLLRNCVMFSEDSVLLRFTSSKTAQFGGKIHEVPLSAIPNSPLCPVVSLLRLFKMTSDVSLSEPVFSLAKGFPITYRHFQKVFKHMICLLGLNPSEFSSHSFRRGGATYAFSSSVPGELIKYHGGWASEAYWIYLQFSLEDKLRVSKHMAHRASLVNMYTS